MKAQTLVELIDKWADQKPDKTAMRQKRYGIWQIITWRFFAEKVLHFSRGLAALGLKSGDRLAVIGDNAPEWLIAEFGAMKIGGICVGLYQDMLLDEVVYLINSSKSRIVVAKDQEQVDKLIDIWEQINEHVIKIIVWDSRGMSHYFKRHSFLIHMDQIFKLGQDFISMNKKTPNSNPLPETVGLMLPTSGTTGLAKLAMISHENLYASASIWQKIHPTYEFDDLYSLLPLSWMGEQFSVSRFLYTGMCYNFPESQESVKGDLCELQPTLCTLSPRMYEDICSDIRARMEDAPFLKKSIYNYALSLALEKAERTLEGKPQFGLIKKVLLSFLMFTTLRSLRQRVGLARIRLAFTGGAAIGREVFTFYLALGINLMQLYGMTENCASATCHYPNDIRPETVGKPLPGVKIRIAEDGLIYIKSPTNIKGYYNNQKATDQTFKDGWLETGDSGYYDQYNHLIVLDRQKDLMFLNDGTRFAPQELENRLKFSPYIREAVVYGDKQDTISAMISIDIENIGNWANKRNIAYTTFMDLSQNSKVIELIREQLKKINLRLPEKMRLVRFVLMPKELHPDDDELTRTRKVKRNVVAKRYKGLIKALYSSQKSYELDVTIRYMDGRKSQLKSTVKIEET